MACRLRNFLTGFFILLQTLWLTACAGAKYESPDYRVVSREGLYEVRDYPSLTLVTAPVSKHGPNAFMQLFHFISGENKSSEKISMTTPVLMSGAGPGMMAFVLPKAVAAGGAPAPSNPDLSLVAKPAIRYAVLRYRGSISSSRALAQAGILSAWIAAKKLQPTGPALFAYYNPPWTPGFLRRNEVLIPIRAEN